MIRLERKGQPVSDVYVKISELETVVSQLGSIIYEFDNATDRSEALEAAIGDPFHRGDLREKAEDFEERWDDKRGDLKESLEKVKEHVQGVIDGFTDWDSETALQFESK